MKKILVSQCLFGGDPVRYDGKSKEETDPRFIKWKAEGRFVPVCPEVFGGLPVPRADAQRKGEMVVSRSGVDVTEEYLKGAEEALRLARENDVICALMKEKSPSCGSSRIYDGSFSGKLIEGQGLATELLRKKGFRVFSEEQIDEVEELIAREEGKCGEKHADEKSSAEKSNNTGRNIVLIGMPACGKSVTGVVLAKSLGMNFVDTDLIIQENEGKSLQRIINEEGIEAFKRAEEKTLLSLDLKNTVIATGGSAVYYPSAMEHMGDNGIIVYIEADIEEIKKRLKNIKTRGVAMSKGQSIDELYEIRKPFYEKYADVTVKSDKRSMEVTVEDIIKSLGNKVSCGY